MLGKITKVQYKKSRPNRSYAFIHGDDGNNYWFSLNGVTGFNVDDVVSFMGERNEKGYVATNVSLFH